MEKLNQERNKIFLIDAYALIYRAYYAFMKNPRVNSKGLNTSAIFGFVNTIDELIRRESPTYIAIAFDPQGKTFRHEAYSEYKAQRPKTPEDIKTAIPYIKEIIDAYGIARFEVEGYEADDVIGTLSKMSQREGLEVYMMTPDKDYAQLVDEHIFQYKPRYKSTGFDTLGIEDIKERYEVDSPLQVIDLLGLMGDSADNIPGCPGIGEKTAIKLIKEFGSIESIIENSDKLKGSVKTKVEKNREKIEFSKFLATIKIDVPLDFSVETVRRKEPDSRKVKELFEELEFKTILNRSTIVENNSTTQQVVKGYVQTSLFDSQAEVSPKPQAVIEDSDNRLKDINTTSHKYLLVDTDDSLRTLIDDLSEASSFCFDTETTSLNTDKAEIVGISFAIESHFAYFVYFNDHNEAINKLALLKPIFEDEKIEKIGQNIKYDILVLKKYGIEVKGKLFDTMVAHYLLQPDLRHNMDYMAEVFLQYKTIHFDELFGRQPQKRSKKTDNIDIRTVNINLLKDYACEDADITLQLKKIFEKDIKTHSLDNIFYEIEMPLLSVLAKIECNGVLVDDFALASSAQILKNQIGAIEREIISIAGYTLNISSPKQIGELLFDKLNISEKPKKTKTGQYQTDEETLQKLKEKHPIVRLILEYRGIKKLLSTYIEALPLLINATTGKIHTSYNQTVVATGRLSSSNPNLQNIPVRDEKGREIRKSFIAEPNSLLMAADYSQVELRIMAHLSGDKNMTEAFLSNQDIHAATAAKIFKVPIEQVTSDMRRKAKTANFGIIYGISAFGLSERLEIPRKEATMLIQSYFESFPDVKTYMEQSIAIAQENGYVTTLFGRRRYLADINSRNSNVRGFAERNAINAPIQGTAADIIKIAMINIDNKLTEMKLHTQMIMQVHDELVFNVPINELDEVKELVRTEMESATKLNIPLLVDIGVGNNWLEAH